MGASGHWRCSTVTLVWQTEHDTAGTPCPNSRSKQTKAGFPPPPPNSLFARPPGHGMALPTWRIALPSLPNPSGTFPEVCHLRNSKSSQADSENHRKGKWDVNPPCLLQHMTKQVLVISRSVYIQCTIPVLSDNLEVWKTTVGEKTMRMKTKF